MYHGGETEGIKMVLVLLGLAGALAVLVCLFALDFSWFSLVYYVPALAVSALLIFVGRSRLKAKTGKDGAR
jgi:hypothetical protein